MMSKTINTILREARFTSAATSLVTETDLAGQLTKYHAFDQHDRGSQSDRRPTTSLGFLKAVFTCLRQDMMKVVKKTNS